MYNFEMSANIEMSLFSICFLEKKAVTAMQLIKGLMKALFLEI